MKRRKKEGGGGGEKNREKELIIIIILEGKKRKLTAVVQNQQTKELIKDVTQKHNNRNLSHLFSRLGVYVPCVYSHARWELPLLSDVTVLLTGINVLWCQWVTQYSNTTE